MIKTFLVFFTASLTLLMLVPFGVIAFILSLAGLKKPAAYCTYKMAQGWGLTLTAITGCRVEIAGQENIPRKGGVCFVSNHGGMFDIILALAYAGRPFGFVAKKELLLIPFLNMWISILGGLFIDRKNPRKALKTINEGVKRLKNGGGMLIFPEGHRSRGEGLLPFRSGSLKLATLSKVPIIPVSIKGSYEVFEANRRVRAVPVRMVFGAPVFTAPPAHTSGRTIETGEAKTPFTKQELADKIRALVEEGLK